MGLLYGRRSLAATARATAPQGGRAGTECASLRRTLSGSGEGGGTRSVPRTHRATDIGIVTDLPPGRDRCPRLAPPCKVTDWAGPRKSVSGAPRRIFPGGELSPSRCSRIALPFAVRTHITCGQEGGNGVEGPVGAER